MSRDSRLSRQTFPDQLWVDCNNLGHLLPDAAEYSEIPRLLTLHAVAASKRRGDASEAAFLARATDLGFTVCLPWGAGERYDNAVNFGGGFLRVQVKCATGINGSYRVRTTGRSGVYTPEEIDFFVVHIVRENVWYIIPIEAVGKSTSLSLSPQRHVSRGEFEKYREAWCLLACPRKERGWKDVPILCRCRQLPVRCAVCPNGGLGS